MNSAGEDISLNSPQDKLPGRFFDLIPQNIIKDEKGKYIYFDQEWDLKGGVELGHLIFRSLYIAINSITKFGENFSYEGKNKLQFFQAVFNSLEFTLSNNELCRYIDIESSVQNKLLVSLPASILSIG